MAVAMSSVNVPTSPAQNLGIVPGGGTMIISSNEISADVFLGTTSGVTSSNGAVLDIDGPTYLHNPVSAPPFTVWAIAGTGSHQVGVIIITPK